MVERDVELIGYCTTQDWLVTQRNDNRGHWWKLTDLNRSQIVWHVHQGPIGQEGREVPLGSLPTCNGTFGYCQTTIEAGVEKGFKFGLTSVQRETNRKVWKAITLDTHHDTAPSSPLDDTAVGAEPEYIAAFTELFQRQV